MAGTGTVVMPRLSDSMEEGTILEWLKGDGEAVTRDADLVEIETDKTTTVYASDFEGTLRILVGAGETVAVGTAIAEVGEPGSPAPATPPADAAPPAEPATATTPAGAGARVAATPVARRMAQEHGIDLAEVTGSGRDGRVAKIDVVRALERADSAPPPPAEAPATPAAPVASPAPAGARGEPAVEPLTRTQTLIAQRMSEAKAQIPEFWVEASVDMSAAVELREQIKQSSDGRAPSLNDFVIRACALTLRDHPRFNASYEGDRLALWPRVNIGMAVAAEATLVVPTIFDADRKALGEIARETRALAGRVRDGSVAPADLGGGTFTVSNLGGMGIARFAAVINPPQAAILAVGAVVRAPVEVDGALRFQPTMTVGLTCDHRVVYGADAAAFLADLRGRLERPLLLAL